MTIVLILLGIFIFILWYSNEKAKAKAKKEGEESKKAYRDYKWEQDAEMRELYTNLPPGYGLRYNLKNEKLSDEYIALLKKPMHHYTESDNILFDNFGRNYRTYKLPL